MPRIQRNHRRRWSPTRGDSRVRLILFFEDFGWPNQGRVRYRDSLGAWKTWDHVEVGETPTPAKLTVKAKGARGRDAAVPQASSRERRADRHAGIMAAVHTAAVRTSGLNPIPLRQGARGDVVRTAHLRVYDEKDGNG
jgi:hypothetical protein